MSGLGAPGSPRPFSPRLLGVGLMLALPFLLLVSVRVGVTGVLDLEGTLQGLGAVLGLGEPLGGTAQTILELRLWRVLTTAGVGAALALSGSLVQGLFRNGLAAPSLLGVTGGASLGATIGILLLGGYGPALMAVEDAGVRTFVVPVFGFAGAFGAVLLVAALASRAGRFSVPTLLLTGIAVNTCIAGVLSLLSSLLLDDWEVSRAILSWTFGTLADRSAWHVATVWAGLGLSALVVPFLAWELDLLQGGEEDAQGLGVDVRRVRLLAVGAASLAAASAVAVAGQIAFLGLVVPHLLRLLSGSGHKGLLPLSLPGGAVFLLGVELLNRGLLAERALAPGVVMSLVGGPFFVLLLLLAKRESETW